MPSAMPQLTVDFELSLRHEALQLHGLKRQLLGAGVAAARSEDAKEREGAAEGPKLPRATVPVPTLA